MALRHLPPLGAVLALLIAVAGCGGGGSSQQTTAPAGDYLSADALQVGLGNGFRAGLARLAVMQQRGDDATDLGQPLTPGLLDRARCAPDGARPSSAGPWSWTCVVTWQTAAGAPQRTRYAVRATPGGCFSAGASPERRTRWDPTIRAYSDDPLNAIVSADPACS